MLGPGADGTLLPIEVALADSQATKPLADELARLERILPVLLRAGGLRRGQVYLSQAEAWELMTVTGAVARGGRVRGAGAGAVAPQADAGAAPVRRADAATPSSAPTSSSNVRWSAVFDDVELTAAEIARLAAEARPLVRSRGRGSSSTAPT